MTYLKRISIAEVKGQDQVHLPFWAQNEWVSRVDSHTRINQRDNWLFNQLRGINFSYIK